MRLAIVLGALATLAVFGVEHRGQLALLMAGGALPWAVAILMVARRSPRLALHPVVVVGDLVILALGEVAAPGIYAAVRFLAIFLFAAHAHYQGEQRGAALAVAGSVFLIAVTLFVQEPLSAGALGFSEALFAITAICTGIFIGRLRAAESTGRLRARDLSRRTIEAEASVRRRIAIALHDGPIQVSVSLDITLDAARRALARGDAARAAQALAEARILSEEVVSSLREELIGLGPYALEELSVNEAIERCAPGWRRRFKVEMALSLEQLEMPDEICGALFGITQEAVANAGRHAGASTIEISLRAVDGAVELRIFDDGHGFRADPPLGPHEPGHIGLASMRERAELHGGTIAIDSSEQGTSVTVRVPLHAPAGTPAGR
ncbi:MAG: sensor histidine kinase [Thermoleophilaceae bacterium]